MASIASKNPYEMLGNDPELDPDREPEPPTKAIDKPVPRSGKRNAGGEAPATTGGRGRGGRGGPQSYSGNEGAFRDRGVGSYQNRNRDDGLREDRHRIRGDGDERPRGRGRGRGPRGRGGIPRDDRHSKTGIADHEKQVAHGWGGNTGGDEWADEKAGEAIAKQEEKEGFDSSVPGPVNAEGESFQPDTGADLGEFVPDASGEGKAGESAEPEPEEPKTKTYEAYLAELAEKKLHLGSNLEARKPNEGASKKFPEGKAIARNEDEEEFIAGTGGKAKRERVKKEKNLLELDGTAMRPQEQRSDRGRGSRGRGRGGDRSDRGDRGDRGDRSDRGDRGDRPERGEFRGRGGRGRGGDRPRGGRGGQSGGPGNVSDLSAFPSLGS